MLCHAIIKDQDVIGFYFDHVYDNSLDNILRLLISSNDDLLIWDKEINTDHLGASVKQSPLLWEICIGDQYFGTYKTLALAWEMAIRMESSIKEGMDVKITPIKEEQGLYDLIFQKPLFDDFRSNVHHICDQLVNLKCTGPCSICPGRLPTSQDGKIFCSLMEARQILLNAINKI